MKLTRTIYKMNKNGMPAQRNGNYVVLAQAGTEVEVLQSWGNNSEIKVGETTMIVSNDRLSN